MAGSTDVVEKVLADFVAECQEDFVEVWSVLWRIRYQLCDEDYPLDVYEQTDAALARELALAVIHTALERGVRAGFYADAGAGEYPPLSAGPPAEVFQRLVADWDRLGHEPSMGELAGFTSVATKHAEPIAAADRGRG